MYMIQDTLCLYHAFMCKSTNTWHCWGEIYESNVNLTYVRYKFNMSLTEV